MHLVTFAFEQVLEMWGNWVWLSFLSWRWCPLKINDALSGAKKQITAIIQISGLRQSSRSADYSDMRCWEALPSRTMSESFGVAEDPLMLCMFPDERHNGEERDPSSLFHSMTCHDSIPFHLWMKGKICQLCCEERVTLDQCDSACWANSSFGHLSSLSSVSFELCWIPQLNSLWCGGVMWQCGVLGGRG